MLACTHEIIPIPEAVHLDYADFMSLDIKIIIDLFRSQDQMRESRLHGN